MPLRPWLALVLAAIIALAGATPARAAADLEIADVIRGRDVLAATRARGVVEWLRTAGLYDQVRARVEARTYAATPLAAAGEGRWEVANPAQRLRAGFTPAGVEVRPAAGDWQSQMQLVGVGRGEAIAPVGAASVDAEGRRVELRYASGLVEWYDNSPRGIEQGFTIPERPGPAGASPLELVMAVRGDLSPSLAPSGDEVRFRSADGRAVVGYRDLRAWDARGRALASRMAVDAGRVRLVVEDRDAAYPVTVDPLFYDAATLTPTGGLPDDEFGWSIALAGSTAAVGAPSRGGAGEFKGSVFVFTLVSGAWVQQAEITAEADAKNLDSFGAVVGLANSGNTLMVGAPGTDVGDDRRDAGAVYVFTRSGTTWTRQARLTASDGVGGDSFGLAAAISGDTIAVGAPFHDPGGKPLGGAAYVFTRTGTTWAQTFKLSGGESLQAGDAFGYGVAISKNSTGDKTILVGAPFFHQGVVGPQVGRVTVFVGNGAAWAKQINLAPSDGGNGDAFGFAVAIDGNSVIVGAPGHDIGDKQQAGQAYVFVRTGTAWSQQAVLSAASDAAAGDQFGVAVDIGGDVAVVGAPLHDVTAPGACESTCDGAGQVYIFRRDGASWQQDGVLTARPPAPQQFFGFSVALDGTSIAVGAPFHAADASPGPSYVFSPGALFGLAKVWVGLKNSDSVGLRLDLKAELRVGGTLVATGQLDDVPAGSSGFNNAFLRTISLYAVPGVGSVSGTVSVKVSVRAACSGVGQLTGVPRLWYNGRFVDTGATRGAGSRIEIPGRLFLRPLFALSPSAGLLALTIDQPVDSLQPCPGRQFLPFGTWSGSN